MLLHYFFTDVFLCIVKCKVLLHYLPTLVLLAALPLQFCLLKSPSHPPSLEITIMQITQEVELCPQLITPVSLFGAGLFSTGFCRQASLNSSHCIINRAVIHNRARNIKYFTAASVITIRILTKRNMPTSQPKCLFLNRKL